MPKTHSPYAPEYRRQMVELVRSGRTPGELAQQLDELLAADRLPDLKLLEQRFVAHLNDVPLVTVDIPGADSYDALFAARELAA